MRTRWEKPELIVLLRGKPEEVLTALCKSGNINAPGYPGSDSQGCGVGTVNCAACNSRGGGMDPS
jgi:hypothetical protein